VSSGSASPRSGEPKYSPQNSPHSSTTSPVTSPPISQSSTPIPSPSRTGVPSPSRTGVPSPSRIVWPPRGRKFSLPFAPQYLAPPPGTPYQAPPLSVRSSDTPQRVEQIPRGFFPQQTIATVGSLVLLA